MGKEKMNGLLTSSPGFIPDIFVEVESTGVSVGVENTASG